MIAQNAGPSLSSETYLTSSHDENQAIDVEVEFTDPQKEDNPEPSFQQQKLTKR